jgi:uncharacterized damage-inducible protein DinB
MIRMKEIYGVNHWMAGACLDGFAGEDWWTRVSGSNPAIWQLGHILSSRKYVAGILGAEVTESPVDELFGIGTNPDDLPRDLDPAALLEEFNQVHAAMIAHLETMTPEDLEADVTDEFPMMPKTKLGALQFLLMHESYHLGQLGELRVMLGKGSWLA